MADDTTDTDQIEHDLAETRARMDRRLDELGDRLAPDQIVNDALSHVSGGSGSDFAQTLIAKAKANPLPAAMTGAGIIWLMASSQRQRARPAGAGPDLEERLHTAEAGVVPDGADAQGMRVKGSLASAKDTLRATKHDLGANVSSAAGRFGDQARRNGDALRGRARSARQALASPDGKNLALGGAAALVGLIAGLVIPVSDAEERTLGNVAGQLRSKGRGLAQDVADRGAEVARTALGAVKDTAQDHGLSADMPVGELFGELRSGELAAHVKDVASAGKDSVQSQLGKADDQQQ